MLTQEQEKRALEWYGSHDFHVNHITKDTLDNFPPSDEDINDPALWKPEHWLWFRTNYKTLEDRVYLQKQENIYHHNFLLDKRWYISLFGGEWYYLKFGKDTPYIGMFATWTKMNKNSYLGYVEVLDIEKYPYTGVDTKKKLYKKMFSKLIGRSDENNIT